MDKKNIPSPDKPFILHHCLYCGAQFPTYRELENHCYLLHIIGVKR